jgi:hypothetical protein
MDHDMMRQLIDAVYYLASIIMRVGIATYVILFVHAVMTSTRR